MLLRALLLALALGAAPAAAFDLFPRHDVTAQFASRDGKPMANAEVRVFSPDNPRQPVLTGHTNADGKFEFPADRDGLWSAEARTADEVARVMIRVGNPSGESRISPFLVLGLLALLLLIAVWYRFLRVRRPRR
jgi:nickel transport protein